MSNSGKKWNPVSLYVNPRILTKVRGTKKKYGFFSPNFIFSTFVLVIVFFILLIPNEIGYEGFFSKASNVDLSSTNVGTSSVLIDGLISDSEYANSFVDSSRGFKLFTEHNATHLFIGIQCETKGWCAVGFNKDLKPSNAMIGADIKLASVSILGETIAEDRYAKSASEPQIDKEPSVNTISKVAGSETSDITTIEFALEMNKGDNSDTVLTPGSTYLMLYAFGDDDEFGYHTSKNFILFEILE